MNPLKKKGIKSSIKKIRRFKKENLDLSKINPVDAINSTKNKILNFYNDIKKNREKEKIRLQKKRKLDEKKELQNKKKEAQRERLEKIRQEKREILAQKKLIIENEKQVRKNEEKRRKIENLLNG